MNRPRQFFVMCQSDAAIRANTGSEYCIVLPLIQVNVVALKILPGS
jgi:hypothetical protein